MLGVGEAEEAEVDSRAWSPFPGETPAAPFGLGDVGAFCTATYSVSALAVTVLLALIELGSRHTGQEIGNVYHGPSGRVGALLSLL